MAAIPHLNPGSTGLAVDTRSLDSLRSRAASDPKAAVREVAKQFESLFMNELMKTMRASTMSSGMLDNGGSQLGTEMLDTQFATKLTGLPGGLSDAIARHLERQMGMSPGPIPVTRSANNTPAPLEATPKPVKLPQVGAAGFVQQHQAAADRAEAQTGIPAAFMVAQAAHETGWGRKEIRHADGAPSFNLFGIKAGANWQGPVAEITTTEYVGGQAQKVVAKFRAYGSYAESFADYAKLMKDSPRYRETVAQAKDASSFAQGLQRAGYATDPAYADKLTRVINTTLRLQRTLT
ncbi:MAG: flagellar assembly peptidoglycan hydrolase FlgJ [Rubrivivax sp.]|nr:flagellar assembly peptidoglycan hydrolase FlgJ [Rubrivivax sp.]